MKKRYMRKLLLLIGSVLCFSFVACNSPKEQLESNEPVKEEAVAIQKEDEQEEEIKEEKVGNDLEESQDSNLLENADPLDNENQQEEMVEEQNVGLKEVIESYENVINRGIKQAPLFGYNTPNGWKRNISDEYSQRDGRLESKEYDSLINETESRSEVLYITRVQDIEDNPCQYLIAYLQTGEVVEHVNSFGGTHIKTTLIEKKGEIESPYGNASVLYEVQEQTWDSDGASTPPLINEIEIVIFSIDDEYVMVQYTGYDFDVIEETPTGYTGKVEELVGEMLEGNENNLVIETGSGNSNTEIDVESTLPGIEWLETLAGKIKEPKFIVYNDKTNKKEIYDNGEKITLGKNDVLALYRPNEERLASIKRDSELVVHFESSPNYIIFSFENTEFEETALTIELGEGEEFACLLTINGE